MDLACLSLLTSTQITLYLARVNTCLFLLYRWWGLKESLKNLSHAPVRPIIHVRAKWIKKVVNGLIQRLRSRRHHRICICRQINYKPWRHGRMCRAIASECWSLNVKTSWNLAYLVLWCLKVGIVIHEFDSFVVWLLSHNAMPITNFPIFHLFYVIFEVFVLVSKSY